MEIRYILNILKQILYELQPVRPDYAYKTITSFVKFIIELFLVITKGIWVMIEYLIQFLTSLSIRFVSGFLIWSIVMAIFVYIEFGMLGIFITLFGLLFYNLGERKKGELSAYSVFNDNFQRILGTTTGEDIDNELRHRN